MEFDVELVNAFYAAASRVLEAELDDVVGRGDLSLVRSDVTGGELNSLVAVQGDLQGYVLFEMNQNFARKLTARMLNQDIGYLRPSLVESAVAELGNMIVGDANARLEESGLRVKASPPEVIVGRNTIVSDRKDTRLRIPILLRLGRFDIEVSETRRVR